MPRFQTGGFMGSPQGVKPTPEGGLAVRYVNRTGAPSVKGTLVAASLTYAFAVRLQTNEYDSVGVVYDDGVPDGEPMWVVVTGQADVLLEDGTAATLGNILIASDVDGRGDCTVANPGSGLPAVDIHFKECGHCLQSVTAGTSKMARCTLHFN